MGRLGLINSGGNEMKGRFGRWNGGNEKNRTGEGKEGRKGVVD